MIQPIPFEFAGLERATNNIANNTKAKCSCSIQLSKQAPDQFQFKFQFKLLVLGLVLVLVLVQIQILDLVLAGVECYHNNAAINAKCKPLARTKTSGPQPDEAGNSNTIQFPQSSCKSLMQSNEFTAERPIKQNLHLKCLLLFPGSI